MNLRITIILALCAIVAGIVVYINPFEDREAGRENLPWFYKVDMSDIEILEVDHKGSHAKFLKTEQKTWAFEDPEGIPPDIARWGGITLLFSGPKTKRDLTIAEPTIENPAQYGLDNPLTILGIGLSHDRNLQLRLGEKTSDGFAHYTQVIGFPQLYLVDTHWGDLLAELATDPPLPKWYKKLDLDVVMELNLKTARDDTGERRVMKFRKEEGIWTVRNVTEDEEAKFVDTDRWEKIMPLLGGPPNVSVAFPKVEDLDYTPYGINDDSAGLEIRFQSVSHLGTKYNEGVGFKLGSKAPNGKAYYAVQVSDNQYQPVLFLDAEWISTLFGLLEDTPYASASTETK